MAHPDDVDFSAAGTVARAHRRRGRGRLLPRHRRSGGRVRSHRSRAPRWLRSAVRNRRRRPPRSVSPRSTSSATSTAASRSTMELRHDISSVIRTVRPQVVITHSPVRNLASTYGSHPDHIAVGEAAMCAVYPDARNPFAFPGLPCARTRRLGGRRGVDPERARGERVRRHHRRARSQDRRAAVPHQPARRSRRDGGAGPRLVGVDRRWPTAWPRGRPPSRSASSTPADLHC